MLDDPEELGEVGLTGDEAKRILLALAWREIWSAPPSGPLLYVYDAMIENIERHFEVLVSRFEDANGDQGFAYELRPKEKDGR